MLKYIETKIVFQEIPDEISLAINLTKCPCHCEGCHSPYLAEDTGEVLDCTELHTLVDLNQGITCVVFMGGDNDPNAISALAEQLKFYRPDLKVGWYSGRDQLAPIDLKYFDFIKVGSYQKDRGGLDNTNTNQRFYEVNHQDYSLIDKTYKFQKNED